MTKCGLYRNVRMMDDYGKGVIQLSEAGKGQQQVSSTEGDHQGREKVAFGGV